MTEQYNFQTLAGILIRLIGRKIFGTPVPENKGFQPVDLDSVLQEEQTHPGCDLFVNPENTIAYLVDKSTKPRVFAYSVFEGGFPVITGNFGIREHESWYIARPKAHDWDLGETSIRDVTSYGINPVLKDHKQYLEGLGVVPDPTLPWQLVEAYEDIIQRILSHTEEDC